MTADDRPLRIAPLWAADPGMRAIMAALTAEGAEARFVGGCVRNALLGPEAPAETDIDVAINRPPPETIRLLEQAGLKAIPTGVEHGTVTAATPDVDKSEESPGERRVAAVEVTSLRRDVETDGRRAVVAFTEDWAEDAGRRDFTMNALYADADGVVHDPLGQGRSDLAARRVRFIGAAEQRIREDYLRSLRYFRFYAWYGAAGGLDPEDLSAVTRLASGIDGLARERIGAETRKLLAAPDPAAALGAMARSGALARAVAPVATPDEHEAARRLAALIAVERAEALAPRWTRRLAALLDAPLDLAALTETLRLSNDDARLLEAIGAARAEPPAEAAYRRGAEIAWSAAALAAAAGGADAIDGAVAAAVRRGAEAPRSPLTAKELIAAGVAPGPALGAALRRAEQAWIDSGFTLDIRSLLIAARPE